MGTTNRSRPIRATAGPALFLLGAAVALGAADAAGAAEPSRRPNIVLILADDFGRDWVGCYGSSQPTPHLDRLAARGVRFENAWCAPLCTPSRLMLLTGRYPFRTGWTVHHDVPRWAGKGFDPEAFTSVARLLKAAGYATAVVGKWQVNDLRPDPEVLKKHGFDAHAMWTGGEHGNPISDRRYWDPFLQIDGERRTHTGAFGPDVLQAYAKDFIRKHRAGPFFLYYPLLAPHGPLEPTPGSARRPDDQLGLHADLVTHLDAQVGEILALLAELGIDDHTAVVFAGDNGSAVGGTLGGRRMPPGKGKSVDLGVHIPLIVRAPMVTKGGTVTSALADFTDLLPTLAELAGAAIPDGLTLDGHSLVPLLRGEASNGRDWLFAQYGGARTVRDRRFKLDSSGAVFDLAADPLEKTDLRASNDPEVVEARRRLAGILASMPPDAPPPFEGFGVDRHAGTEK